MNLQPAFFAEKLAQLEHLEHTKQLDQIFEWVKTGHISRAIFKGLITYVEHFNGLPAAQYISQE